MSADEAPNVRLRRSRGGQEPVEDDTLASQDAIQGGTLDSEHTFVVGVGTNGGGWCTGALIAPNLVLTARHCVSFFTRRTASGFCDEDFTTLKPLAGVFITTAANKRDADPYRVSRVVVPTDSPFCGNDIALLVLEKSVPASEATPATPGVDSKLTERVRVGDKVAAIGYGNTSVNAVDFGARRIRRDIPVECLPGDRNSDCLKFIVPVRSTEFNIAVAVCEGDSGSAVFEGESFGRGKPYALGVFSRFVPLGNKCSIATFTRIDSFAELIIDSASQAAREGGYPAPAWAIGPDGN